MRLKKPVSLVAVLLATAALLSGCTGAQERQGSVEPGHDAHSVATDTFPVTITHALGETTIESEPQRVVTLGWAAEDAVVALGVVPVAVPSYGWGADEDGYLPWFRDAVEDMGAPLPETLDAEERSGEVNFEQILGLAPDVILAPFSGISSEDYQRLAQIAPTVAYAEQPWASNWQDLTHTVGVALGRTEQAEKLLESTEKLFAKHAAEHPEFDGVRLAYGMGLTDGSTDLTFYFPADPRVEFVEALGFRTPQSILDFAERSTLGSSDSVSVELLNEYDDVDVFLAWAGNEEDAQRTVGNPVVRLWGPVADGKDLVLTEPSLVWATSSPTALNIPWALDTLVPELAELVAR
ncbi:iron-siderophore ABC transporter substrate-binding protein [Leucobacter luti]|uniref:iron-siderophore ABC transporter substrate-binding protein n=1 Tax=Leucobacter luti TaxID=340320 RepID=UPI001C68D84B|nr:iron-siderophore ABC transporter substrate-binding protein [Leucobacter luti]QYM76248.1 iron-siderophore ABC transporter substrate-binding protein [Leucobacter luti]